MYTELILYLAVLFFLLSRKPVYNLLSELPIYIRFLLLIAAFLMVFAQVNKKSSETYPFVYWGMYSSVYPPNSYLGYEILLNDNEQTHYPFKLVTFTSQRAFMRKLDNLFKEKEYELLKTTFDSLAVIYNKKYPPKKITQFDIYYTTIRKDSSGIVSKNKISVFTHHIK